MQSGATSTGTRSESAWRVGSRHGGILENAMTIEGARMENESQLVNEWMELLQADQHESESPAAE
jgi:hypothetical protein